VWRHLKQRASEHHNHLMHIKKKAEEEGYEVCQKAMCEYANEYLYRNEIMPPPLADFQMKWNAGLIRKRTRDKTDNCLRNLVIAHIVFELGAFGIGVTRRPSQRRHHSRCSIAAAALASELPRRMIKPTERAVEVIWSDWHEFVVQT
jgi:hypothetical protein